MPLGHRLQVLIDDERHQRLVAVAEERGVSIATVVREAIDRGLPNPASRRKAAGQRILDGPQISVPDDPADLIRELNDLRGRRG